MGPARKIGASGDRALPSCIAAALREARREASAKVPDSGAEPIKFTYTVVGVDLAANTLSVIGGQGGAVHTYPVTNLARQEALKGVKTGDVLIGLTTPLLVTAMTPAK